MRRDRQVCAQVRQRLGEILLHRQVQVHTRYLLIIFARALDEHAASGHKIAL